MSDKAATCPSCGVKIAGNVMRCPDCGAVVFKNQEVCPDCHCPLHGNAGTKAEPVTEGPDIVGDTSEPVEAATVTYETEPVEEVPSESVPSSYVSDTGYGNPRGNGHEPDGRQPRKKSYIMIVVAVVILLIVGFIGTYVFKNSQTNAEEDAYENAMESDEPAVLQNYLDIYKDAPDEHRDSVQVHLDRLLQADKDWTDAVVSGSKAALERYLQTHPGSPHETEAKAKIDSLDWVTASQANTTDAYQVYLDAHSDGMYVDEAKDRYAQLDAQKVSPEDRQNISTLFGNFFRSLEANDEDGLTATIANVMDNFLNKNSATKNDVVSFMHKVHTENGDNAVSYRLNNDWRIQKKQAADNSGFEYTVSFSVDQKGGASQDGNAAISTLKVNAKVSSDGKITVLTMKRLVE